MSETRSTPGAVFLSYAREDSEAARRIADALRAFGLEVWFDQSELRGGDTWDSKIKTQIRTCALFMPIISAHTQERSEGYFRREWKLGVSRTHDMASGVAFFVPVVIDDITEADALVPEEFMHFQWTRLPRGVPMPQFIEQVRQLLENPKQSRKGGRAGSAPAQPGTAGVKRPPPGRRSPLWAAGALVAAIAIGAFVYFSRKPAAPADAPGPAAAAKPAESAPAVSGKSIAVLPFANFSPDKDNEFFADGLQDEVITALAKIHDLKVISRTSVLAYRNPDGRNLKKIANELGVATVLEGSVQRVGTKVHLNVQLIDARTDDHLWADSYTEELTDVFSLEASLAQQIASALKANLTSDEQALISRRPTQNQEAYDLYLRALILRQDMNSVAKREEYERVLAGFEEAAARDPSFSLPHVQASMVDGEMYWFSPLDPTAERKAKALAELEAAQRLAPTAPETRLAQGWYDYTCLNDWNGALAEYRAAAAELPNDAQLHFGIGLAFRRLGRYPEALAEFKRSIDLNPNDDFSAATYVETVLLLHRYKEVIELSQQYQVRFPTDGFMKFSVIEAQFQIDGDRSAFIQAAPVFSVYGGDSLETDYNKAMMAGDFQAAERFLSDPKLTSIVNLDGSISDPVSMLRSYVAFLLGKQEEARKFGDAAIEAYRTTKWTPRQQPWVHLGIARAEAYSGRTADAIRDGRAALDEMEAFDGYSSLQVRYEYGALLVICNQREEALSLLREIVAQPMDNFCLPNEIRIHPSWSRLKGDPRFDEILKSVRPL